jgi:hypothetical protein
MAWQFSFWQAALDAVMAGSLSPYKPAAKAPDPKAFGAIAASGGGHDGLRDGSAK